ncbi:hypothetical protein M3J09_004953 [Ascochyta lentis]
MRRAIQRSSLSANVAQAFACRRTYAQCPRAEPQEPSQTALRPFPCMLHWKKESTPHEQSTHAPAPIFVHNAERSLHVVCGGDFCCTDRPVWAVKLHFHLRMDRANRTHALTSV